MPKGHVEVGEISIEAAAREAREEAGVEGDIDPVPLLWVQISSGSWRHNWSRRSHRTPVYALLVRRQHAPQEPWRAPSWRSVSDGAARRAVRRCWPFNWRSRSVMALQRRLSP